MKLVDVNVLVGAAFTSVPNHASSRTWLDQAMRGAEPVALPWASIVGFVRIATRKGIFSEPLDMAGAMAYVESWLGRPHVHPIEPGPDHAGRLSLLLVGTPHPGDLVPDAHLAALAQANRATVVSWDSDFGRFPGVPWRTPDQLLSGA